ncbi:MAG: VWA domain-containing protein [Planctomycetes bacterium]|nr:VWA domain-containing protein [Planctomycetota bacterium]
MTHLHIPGTPTWLTWAYPWALLALLLLPLLWWLWNRRDRQPVIRFSGLEALRGAAGASRRRRVLPILRIVALAALILACARPQKADESSRVFAEGVAIQLAVDVSSSMGDYDLSPPGVEPRMDRLAVVKDIVRDFVLGKEQAGGPSGRPDDLIGLIRFARYADSVCPLTLDHKNLADEIEQTHWIGEPLVREMDSIREKGGSRQRFTQLYERFRQLSQGEDGTNIGAGLALAVERLRDLKRTTGSGQQLKITSRVVILLTDGENNVEDIISRVGVEPTLVTISPVQAGELAATNGIKVYTIAAGTGQLLQRPDFFGNVVATGRRPLNDADLRKIAELTGGKHYVATDRDSLKRIYEEIDRLERTKIEERSFVRWGELSLPLLLAAFFALAASTLLDATWLRKIP